MTKKEKARIKAELIQVRDEKLGVKSVYICNCCTRYSTVEFIHENKPSPGNAFESFTKGEYWQGTLSWWDTTLADMVGRYEELMEEKRRYLTQLIETL